MDSSKLHVERALLKDNLLSENYKRTQKKYSSFIEKPVSCNTLYH